MSSISCSNKLFSGDLEFYKNIDYISDDGLNWYKGAGIIINDNFIIPIKSENIKQVLRLLKNTKEDYVLSMEESGELDRLVNEAMNFVMEV